MVFHNRIQHVFSEHNAIDDPPPTRNRGHVCVDHGIQAAANMQLDEGFSGFSEVLSFDEDGFTNADEYFTRPGQSPSNRKQFTKLEVLKARQVEMLLRWHHFFVLVGILYTVLVVVILNAAFVEIFMMDPRYSDFDLKYYEVPPGLVWFDYVGRIPMFFFLVLLFIIFLVRIIRLDFRSRTKEQIWICFLLFSMVLYFNPYDLILKIRSLTDSQNNSQQFTNWSASAAGQRLRLISNILQTSGFTGSTVFYVWASLHSYRILSGRISYMFYIPKVIVVSLYVASKVLVATFFNIIPAETFFVNIVIMNSSYRAADHWTREGVIYAYVTFAFEIVMSVYLLLEYRWTKRTLQDTDYIKFRSKQIGFRFFIYHNVTFHFAFLVLYLILLVALPSGNSVFFYLLFRLSFFRVHEVKFGMCLMLLAYVTVETFVNLPADAIGFKGLFIPVIPSNTSSKKSELEPITYRKREPPSIRGIVSDLSGTCFVMQTHVILFNFAWLVYYWDTPKLNDFNITQDVFKFSITEYIKDETTDTHVIVVDADDRIVIAFKGTTSSKNLKTDINMFYSKLNSLLPTKTEDEDGVGEPSTEDNSSLLKSIVWSRAKIHKGFAMAYAAVGKKLLSVVQRLKTEKKRPVFLTGHSLGGALATICSLDLFLQGKLTRQDIFVSTFGAPRVGNRSFRMIYDNCVPIHWRIVVGPDVVAKLPKMGYSHTGKKVLLTVDGDLFIDPNSLELNLWSGDVASILYHRKASYLLAMRAWCDRHHGDEYVPEFWPFPVSKDDTKRFQHTMPRHGGEATTSSCNSRGFGSRGVCSRSGGSRGLNSRVFGASAFRNWGTPRWLDSKNSHFMRLGAMVEALSAEEADNATFSPQVLQGWRQLTLAVLANRENKHLIGGMRYELLSL